MPDRLLRLHGFQTRNVFSITGLVRFLPDSLEPQFRHWIRVPTSFYTLTRSSCRDTRTILCVSRQRSFSLKRMIPPTLKAKKETWPMRSEEHTSELQSLRHL